MGAWNDHPGMLLLYFLRQRITIFLQELFTRLPPFHDQQHIANVMHKLLQRKLPARPNDASTCSRMTDAWWNICLSCWNYDALLRPTAAGMMQSIKKIMVRRCISRSISSHVLMKSCSMKNHPHHSPILLRPPVQIQGRPRCAQFISQAEFSH